MDVREVYQRIQELQDMIAAVGPLDPEVRKRIDYKFRLDWNYHSNNIEGGTLTVAETKSIMLGHVTVEDKPIRDVLEMRGHDQVVKTIFSIGRGEVQLSEKRIKEIHAAIIHEDDPTQQHLRGSWKQSPNEIINKGEKVAFTAPADVSEAMHQLLDWFKVEQDKIKRKDKEALPAPRLAFEFHLRFLTIHPFYDGNGRVGRILLNLILINLGYPPIIVTQADKPKYNDLLTEIQLNGGSRNDLWVFLGRLLIRSLELVKRAIDGEEIDEEMTPEERLQRMENQWALIDKDKKIRVTLDYDVLVALIATFVIPTAKDIYSKIIQLRKNFVNIEISLFDQNGSRRFEFTNHTNTWEQEFLDLYSFQPNRQASWHKITLDLRMIDFIHGGELSFNAYQQVEFEFSSTKYKVTYEKTIKRTGGSQPVVFANRLLHKEFTEHDRLEITNLIFESILDVIEYEVINRGIQ